MATITIYQVIANGRVRDTSGTYSMAERTKIKLEQSGLKNVEIKIIQKES